MALDPQLHQIKKTLFELPFPSRFAVELCAECNLACSMCHHPQMKRPKGVMPFELWRRCADQVAERSPRSEVWFSFCGEPLLEPELLLEMLAYGRSVGLRSMNINTNGMLLTADLDDRILLSGAQRIVFGVDGFSKEVFESIRVNADRDVVYANVGRLLARKEALGVGPEINVQFVEMDENEHEVGDFAAFWRPMGATLKIRNKLSWGGKLETSLCIAPEDRIPCPWAMTMMHVFWDGRVPRCPGDTEGDPDEEAGNAWHEPLDVLWDRLGKFRTLHMQGAWEELPERCHTCKDWMTGAAVRVHPDTHVASGKSR